LGGPNVLGGKKGIGRWGQQDDKKEIYMKEREKEKGEGE
jgi:hypothetical protein